MNRLLVTGFVAFSVAAAAFSGCGGSDNSSQFGGSSNAAESLNTAAFGADPSQQQFLTTPQHYS